MALAASDRHAALRDAEYHRYLMFGQADKVQARQLGRPLLTHETQGVLRGPQLDIIRRVERAVAKRAGEVIVVRTARQTAKNECEGMLECRALSVWQAIPGSVWVRTAPTHKPQIVNSKTRLEKHLRADPLLAGRWKKTEGYIYEYGGARIEFLSGGKSANVVGGTASIALSVDEAHKIDRGKFDEDFAPFTASTNAPTVMWGVAAAKQDLLYEYLERAEGTDRVLQFPAAIWCELSEAYRNHYETRRDTLGADHPVIRTQYDLVDIDAVGAYLNAAQRASLFSGDHPRLEGPRENMRYFIVVDIGGESEIDQGDDVVRELEPGRDSTVAWICEYDPRETKHPVLGYTVRVVAGHWWTGKAHRTADRRLVQTCRHWRIAGGVVDARGVGEATAKFVKRHFPTVLDYTASNTDVSWDCFDLLARANNNMLTFWKADPAQDEELREIQAQTRHTRYEIRGHELMKLVKPTGVGSTSLHIDGVKAATYIGRAIGQADNALMDYMRDQFEELKKAEQDQEDQARG